MWKLVVSELEFLQAENINWISRVLKSSTCGRRTVRELTFQVALMVLVLQRNQGRA
jgi:hypothetical protein